jgi:hypothetical protein
VKHVSMHALCRCLGPCLFTRPHARFVQMPGTLSGEVWPQTEPVLRSYAIEDVIEYLEVFIAALAALSRPVERATTQRGSLTIDARLVEQEWKQELAAQLETAADWERASVAYVQLLMNFAVFAEPFEDFMRRVVELGTIPQAEIAFEAWALKCIRLCLTVSGVDVMLETGRCLVHDLRNGTRALQNSGHDPPRRLQ